MGCCTSFQRAVLTSTALLTLLVLSAAAAESNEAERFKAVTANMAPDGLGLRIDVLRWSSQTDREAVISVLASGSTEETPLIDLPTTGYVWPDGSGLGYSVKYAHRVTAEDGSHHITLVTGRPLGMFGREPWEASNGRPAAEEEFTVIELRVDGDGTGVGTMSLATGFTIDTAAGTVSLESSDDTPILLDSVTREPTRWGQRS